MGQHLDKNPTKSTDLQVAIYNSIKQDGYQIKVPIPTENSRFLKTYICSHETKPGTFLVKLFIKSGNIDLQKHANEVTLIRDNFIDKIQQSNVFPFQIAKINEKSGVAYLVREYFTHNLVDRLGTRPFLDKIEKKWITFQLIQALYQAQFKGISHGDIKSENVMLTSWHWVYLTDFASYKPTYLTDDISDWSYFFKTSGRTCYLAPERFQTKVPEKGELTPSMDVFSMGCVIAELFFDERVLFDHSSLLKYKRGKYDPNSIIKLIEDEGIRQLVSDCVQLNPDDRPTIQKLLDEWSTVYQGQSYFPFLHDYMKQIASKNFSERIEMIEKDFELLLSKVIPGYEIKKESGVDIPEFSIETDEPEPQEVLSFKEKLNEMNLYSISEETQDFFIDLQKNIFPVYEENEVLEDKGDNKTNKKERTTFDYPPKYISNDLDTFTDIKSETQTLNGEGVALLLTVVCSSMRNVETRKSKLTAARLLVKMAAYLSDECRLQRIVPYLFSLLPADDEPLIRATVINGVTQVLEMVNDFPRSDSHVFPNYIIPKISDYSKDKSEIVLEAFASCISRLAVTSKKFLEISQKFKTKNRKVSKTISSNEVEQPSLDVELDNLRKTFYSFWGDLISCEYTSVKKRLLMDLDTICSFFERKISIDKIIPFLPTFLNPMANWELRAATFNKIVPVMVFVGHKPLENMLEIFLQTLYDEQETVIEKSINALASFCREGLINKQKILTKLLKVSIPLICHPNQWIRYGVISLISGICENRKNTFSKVDVNCFLMNHLKEFLIYPITKFNQKTLLQAVKRPVPRDDFEEASKVAKESYEISSTSEQLKNFKNEFVIFLKERFRESLEEKKETIETIILMCDFFKEYQKNHRSVKGNELDSKVLSQFKNISISLPYYTEKNSDKNDSMREIPRELTLRDLPKVLSNMDDVDEKLNDDEYQKKYSFYPTNITVNSPTKEKEIANRGPSDYHSIGGLPNERKKYLKADNFQGTLVAHLNEHAGTVNQIAVSDDCQFFASASNDGTVKIWDCQRLKTNVTNRSRLTCKTLKGRVLCVSMMEKSHTVISGSDQGNMHLFNVEYEKKTGNQSGVIKYNAATSTDYIERSQYGAITQIEHFNHKASLSSTQQSVVSFSTSKGFICGVDLRMKIHVKDCWQLENPAKFGLVECYVVDPQRNWLICGTDQGFYNLWDLRFQLLVRTWKDPRGTKINKLVYSTRLGDERIYSCVSEMEHPSITCWDIQNLRCTQIFRANVNDKENPEIKNIEKFQNPPLVSQFDYSICEPSIEKNFQAKHSFRALLTDRNSYIITAGTDKTIRFWDLKEPKSSKIISGPKRDSKVPVYTTSQSKDIDIFQENWVDEKDKINLNMSRNLETNHNDDILDLKFLEPYGMLVSCSRDSIIKVWK